MKKRKVKDIKIWMIKRDITQRAIVSDTGEDQGYVSHTLAGRKNNRKVLAYLLKKGCPKRYLALPKDMEEAA